MLLNAAMVTEVDEHLGRTHWERTEETKGYRNGYRKRSLVVGSGPIEVDVPKVTGSNEQFSIQSIRAWQRVSDEVRRTLPLMYAEGLSTRDFARATEPLWQGVGVSRSSISRANKELYEQFDVWRGRKLSSLPILHLFLDGYYERVRQGAREKEGILVAHGVLLDGSRELLGVQLGPRESEKAWQAVLDDLVRRGLEEPALIITDGSQGLIRGIKSVWPEAPRQRCTAHKTRNVLTRVPRKSQAKVKRDLVKIFHAPDLDEAQQALKAFLAKYGDALPTACETLCRNLDDCLTFYRFPEVHWKRIRTSNAIERAFKEVRRRTRVIENFPNEKSALVVVWATIEQDRLKWRGIKLNDDLREETFKAAEQIKKKPIRIKAAADYLKAA